MGKVGQLALFERVGVGVGWLRRMCTKPVHLFGQGGREGPMDEVGGRTSAVAVASSAEGPTAEAQYSEGAGSSIFDAITHVLRS